MLTGYMASMRTQADAAQNIDHLQGSNFFPAILNRVD